MLSNINAFSVLNLPAVEFKTKQGLEQRTEIFDAFRNKYVVLTPEEWVRQHMLHYIVNEFRYPKNLIGVEVTINRGGKKERADIVVYMSTMEPWMIIECKAAEVELKQHVFDQAARYNLIHGVEYLVITNGIRLMAAEINSELKSFNFLKELPKYPKDL
jgi:predicted type IV restriction endonuclease